MNFKKSDKIKSRRNNLEERSENIIENARIATKISQRELAKLLEIKKYFKWPFDELEDVEHKHDYAKLSKDI